MRNIYEESTINFWICGINPLLVWKLLKAFTISRMLHHGIDTFHITTIDIYQLGQFQKKTGFSKQCLYGYITFFFLIYTVCDFKVHVDNHLNPDFKFNVMRILRKYNLCHRISQTVWQILEISRGMFNDLVSTNVNTIHVVSRYTLIETEICI